MWSNKDQQVIFGVSVVLLVWPDGQGRLPVADRGWHKGGPSKDALALERLSEARQRLQCKPQWVLFDAWYPSKALLKRLRDSGWYCVCRLQKQRGFAGTPWHRSLPQPSWQAVGFLAGAMQGLVVKSRRQYYATHRLSLTATEVRQHDKVRHAVEEVLRTIKSPRGLEACPAGYRRRRTATTRPQPRVQEHHVALCLVASLIVERERRDRSLTWRQCKRPLILKGVQHAVPALERVRRAA